MLSRKGVVEVRFIQVPRSDERIKQLRSVELFKSCGTPELELIARMSDEVRFPTGSELMHEGRTGRECFVLLSGEAVVSIEDEQLAVLGPGDIAGEMAVIEHEPRTATVTAWSPVRALVFTTQEFDAVIDHVPAVAKRVMRSLAQRLREIQAA
jgi:CRP/FNR family transcriptional regulator, cyclic AMP receptor protein